MGRIIDQTADRLQDVRPADPRDRIADMTALFAERVGGALLGTGRYVRSNPWAAVGAIAVATVAAGVWIGRGMRTSRRDGRLINAGDVSEMGGG